MVDLGAVTGVVAALGGVLLGAWLSGRSQLRLQREAQRQATLAAKESAYVEFLATMRRFRRFVLTAPIDVTLVDSSQSPRGPIPIIAGSDAHWDAVEGAISRLWIVTEVDGPVGDLAARVVDALYDIARERAIKERGAVPATVVDVSRTVEREFAREARRDLGRTDSHVDGGLRLKAGP